MWSWSAPLHSLVAAELDTFSSLRAQGDEKFKAGDFQAAMNLFIRASSKAPDDVGLHYRTAKTAQQLKQWRVGLEEIQTMFSLKPDLQSDKEMSAMKAEFEERIKHPVLIPVLRAESDSARKLELDLKTLESLIAGASKAPAPRAMDESLNRARAILESYLADPDQSNLKIGTWLLWLRSE